jgi:hypothetical protein
MHCSGAIADPEADRRDAASLTRLHRAGELTAVRVPDTGHEAMRDLVRARPDAVRALRRARQQPSGFLLRQGCHYGRPAWTKLHRRWLAGLRFEQAAHYIVLLRQRGCGRHRRDCRHIGLEPSARIRTGDIDPLPAVGRFRADLGQGA